MKNLLLLAILPLMTACNGQQEKIDLAKKHKAESLEINSAGQRPAKKMRTQPKPQRGVINCIINHKIN